MPQKHEKLYIMLHLVSRACEESFVLAIPSTIFERNREERGIRHSECITIKYTPRILHTSRIFHDASLRSIRRREHTQYLMNEWNERDCSNSILMMRFHGTTVVFPGRTVLLKPKGKNLVTIFLLSYLSHPQ